MLCLVYQKRYIDNKSHFGVRFGLVDFSIFGSFRFRSFRFECFSIHKLVALIHFGYGVIWSFGGYKAIVACLMFLVFLLVSFWYYFVSNVKDMYHIHVLNISILKDNIRDTFEGTPYPQTKWMAQGKYIKLWRPIVLADCPNLEPEPSATEPSARAQCQSLVPELMGWHAT